MKKIAFLGLGAMGSRMATKLIETGHDVTVYNRTAERAVALVERGAQLADSPRAAAAGADIVLSMVRDDDASAEVWLADDTGALAGLGPGAMAVECSTLSLPHVRRLSAAFATAGRTFVDAPLAGSRPQAEAAKLIFFVGASEENFNIVKTVLAPLAAAIHHAGATGAGMTLKLMVNGLFGVQLAAFAELIGFARASGIDVPKAIDIIGSTPVCSPAANAAAGAMVARLWSPAFPIALVAKDFTLLHESMSSGTSSLPVSSCTGQVYADAIAAGFGADNITGVVQLYDAALQAD